MFSPLPLHELCLHPNTGKPFAADTTHKVHGTPIITLATSIVTVIPQYDQVRANQEDTWHWNTCHATASVNPLVQSQCRSPPSPSPHSGHWPVLPRGEVPRSAPPPLPPQRGCFAAVHLQWGRGERGRGVSPTPHCCTWAEGLSCSASRTVCRHE